MKTTTALVTGAAALASLGLADAASAATGTIKAPPGEKVVVQSKPSVAGKNLRLLKTGTKIKIVCQTYGQTMSGPFGTSNVWNKLAKGGYVTDTKTYTGSDGLVAPLCGGGGSPAAPKGRDAALVKLRNDYRQTGTVDAYGYYTRQCTSFVAQRLNDGGFPLRNWFKGQHFGDAKLWDDAARNLGIPVDTTPRRGSVMVRNSGTWGHVAVVAKVRGDQILVEQYNAAGTEQYSQQWLSKAGMVFIHFKR